MKKTAVISLFILFISCKDESLIIEKLSLENKELKEKIDKLGYERLISSQLISMPNAYNLNIGKKNSITGFFYQNYKYPAYELFFADETFNKKEKINFTLLENNKFEFDYTPTTKKDTVIRIIAVFDLDSIKVHFPSEIFLKPDRADL